MHAYAQGHSSTESFLDGAAHVTCMPSEESPVLSPIKTQNFVPIPAAKASSLRVETMKRQ